MEKQHSCCFFLSWENKNVYYSLWNGKESKRKIVWIEMEMKWYEDSRNIKHYTVFSLDPYLNRHVLDIKWAYYTKKMDSKKQRKQRLLWIVVRKWNGNTHHTNMMRLKIYSFCSSYSVYQTKFIVCDVHFFLLRTLFLDWMACVRCVNVANMKRGW